MAAEFSLKASPGRGVSSVSRYRRSEPSQREERDISYPCYFGAGRPCMAPSAFTQYSAYSGHIFDEPSERGSHEEFLERRVPSFIVNTEQLAPHTISWALTQGM